MDVYGIEALLGLPEFRVMDQVIGPYPVTGSQSRSCLVCRGALFVNIFRWTGQLGFRYKLGLAPFSVRLSCLERS